MTITAHPKKPVVAFSYVEPKDLPKLVTALGKSGMPRGTPVYLGSYGISDTFSAQVHKLPGAKYAPLFDLKPNRLWEKRHLAAADAKKVPADPKLSGRIPTVAELGKLTGSERVAFGAELGRRMRDHIRESAKAGVKVDAWQFDELLGEASGPKGAGIRQFTRGILTGLHGGRKELGDPPMQGLTYLAHTSLPIAGMKPDGELSRFWKTLDQTSLRIVGEEYPDFRGDPKAAANAQSTGQRLLAHGGPIRQALADKYMVGMSPGYRLGGGLGGNTAHLTRGQVNHWRDAFIDARRKDGVAGYAEYNFRFENASATVMQDTASAVARAVAKKR